MALHNGFNNLNDIRLPIRLRIVPESFEMYVKDDNRSHFL